MSAVSVITIIKDDYQGLKNTFESLARQQFHNWDLTIVVGKSSDQSLETAKLYESTDTRVRVIKQSGLGLYQAMNEGLRNVYGEYCWFMNAGDTFFGTEALGFAYKRITDAGVDLVIGGHMVCHKGRIQAFVKSNKQLAIWSFAFNRRGGCHQAMLFRTKKLLELGGFDTRYRLSSDFRTVLMLTRSSRVLRLNSILCEVEPGGIADSNLKDVIIEKHIIRKELLDTNLFRITNWWWTILALSKLEIKRIFRSVKCLI